MIETHTSTVYILLAQALGEGTARRLLAQVELPGPLPVAGPGQASRAELAVALTVALFGDVLDRVPLAAAYVADLQGAGRKLRLDHGALRTVAAPCGALPGGDGAFRRLLEPLGFAVAGVYPLPKLGMTGRAYAHQDLPAGIAQFFVSELHPERFSASFQAAVQRVVGNSRDPLTPSAVELLARLQQDRHLPLAAAARLLLALVACFDRQHDEPGLADYELLLAESPEMAWIATEGNAYNHATDRVADVDAVAAEQRRLGRAIKDRVEVSANGRVRQTAFRAGLVRRGFRDRTGQRVERLVPGSFHEFITRLEAAPGVLDLSFDSGNATAIFAMTGAESGAPRA